MNVDAGVGRQAAAGSLPPLSNYSWPGRHQTTGLTLLQGFLVFRVCLSCLCLMYMVDALIVSECDDAQWWLSYSVDIVPPLCSYEHPEALRYRRRKGTCIFHK